jgi:DNA polymerase (family 10)/putative hydrolase
MKTWEKYSDYLLEGEWHVHTDYTDGRNTVFEYCERAVELNIPLIAFTEHVRRELDYDFNSFLSDIEDARKQYDLIILSGCEAKVLPNGELDVDVELLRNVDYPIFAFHSFPKDEKIYISSLTTVIENEYVNAWAHPGTFLSKNSMKLNDLVLTQILLKMKEMKVLLEINSKYNVPTNKWKARAKVQGVTLVKGNDVHSMEELQSRSLKDETKY